jgi:hypothetical protein
VDCAGEGQGETSGGGGDSFECIVSSCDLGMCLSFPDCAVAVECMGSCSDLACGEDCLALGPSGGPGAQILQDAVECAADSCW